MALEPAVVQEAVEQEAAEDVEEPGSEEPGSASSDAEAIMAFEEAEAVSKEAPALLQEPPDVSDADWGGGAAGSPVADPGDFSPAGDLHPDTMVAPAFRSPAERLGLDVALERIEVFPDYLMPAAGEAMHVSPALARMQEMTAREVEHVRFRCFSWQMV